jgi:hypothetical protein
MTTPGEELTTGILSGLRAYGRKRACRERRTRDRHRERHTGRHPPGPSVSGSARTRGPLARRTSRLRRPGQLNLSRCARPRSRSQRGIGTGSSIVSVKTLCCAARSSRFGRSSGSSNSCHAGLVVSCGGGAGARHSLLSLIGCAPCGRSEISIVPRGHSVGTGGWPHRGGICSNHPHRLPRLPLPPDASVSRPDLHTPAPDDPRSSGPAPFGRALRVGDAAAGDHAGRGCWPSSVASVGGGLPARSLPRDGASRAIRRA